MSEQSYSQATAEALDRGEALSHPGFVDPKDEAKGDKPAHYKVICISMYTKDLKRLDDMVDTLKAKGMTKANRSALIRYALSGVDLDRVPQGM